MTKKRTNQRVKIPKKKFKNLPSKRVPKEKTTNLSASESRKSRPQLPTNRDARSIKRLMITKQKITPKGVAIANSGS